MAKPRRVGCHTALLVIFGARGCAALIYEMVWFHLVQLVGGAAGTVLAGFYLLRVHDVFIASGP